jgi:alkylation response protein AidB-like acyl-CoA dehydrogenase
VKTECVSQSPNLKVPPPSPPPLSQLVADIVLAGSDVAGLQTTAKKSADGKHYIVNGQKKWITNGIWADYCTAAVRTGGPGANGISALIIPLKNYPGVTTRKQSNSGVNASGSTFIEFDDVEVPIENLLGKENQGFKIVMSNFNHERLWLGVTALRMARVCCEDAYSHAITRHTFGQPLLSNQVIRAKFTDMGRSLETTWALIEALIYHSTTVTPAQREKDLASWYALVKVQAGRTLEKVNRECQQVFGGLGYSRGGKGGRVEQVSRDLRVLVVGGGSDEILTDLVARQMDSRRKSAKL